MSALSTIQELTDKERRAVLLALTYQMVRKDAGQYGFWVFLRTEVSKQGNVCPELLRKAGAFHNFMRLLTWFESNDLPVGHDYAEWINYIYYVFSKFYPQIPVPQQIPNGVLLKKFRNRTFVHVEEERNTERLRQLYSQLLGEELESADLLGVA